MVKPIHCVNIEQEGFAMFEDMIAAIREDVTKYAYESTNSQ